MLLDYNLGNGLYYEIIEGYLVYKIEIYHLHYFTRKGSA